MGYCSFHVDFTRAQTLGCLPALAHEDKPRRLRKSMLPRHLEGDQIDSLYSFSAARYDYDTVSIGVWGLCSDVGAE